jgi:hypothetical protein
VNLASDTQEHDTKKRQRNQSRVPSVLLAAGESGSLSLHASAMQFSRLEHYHGYTEDDLAFNGPEFNEDRHVMPS